MFFFFDNGEMIDEKHIMAYILMFVVYAFLGVLWLDNVFEFIFGFNVSGYHT